MGHRVIATVSVAASLLLAAATVSQAQSQLPRPGQLPPPGGRQMAPQQRGQAAPQQSQQPQQQAAKPYQPVAITAPAPVRDPSFEAFRKQLGAIAQRKDRRALGAVVANDFFWQGEKGDKADKRKPGIENLAAAIGLDAKDGTGWGAVDGFAADPTGSTDPERKNEICAPAEPNYNPQALEALAKATGTDEGDWGFPVQPGLQMRAGPQPNAPVVEKLGMHFIRVMPDTGPDNDQNPTVRVAAPSGRVGFVPADAISPLGIDQICYGKDGGGWKIIGFIGGE